MTRTATLAAFAGLIAGASPAIAVDGLHAVAWNEPSPYVWRGEHIPPTWMQRRYGYEFVAPHQRHGFNHFDVQALRAFERMR